jgi:hypothetical protein
VLNTVRIGIDPEGLPSFFQKLLGTQQEQPDVVEAFLSRAELGGGGIGPDDGVGRDSCDDSRAARDPGALCNH